MLTMEDLIERQQAGETLDLHLFWKRTRLSQWAGTPFTVAGIVYPTAEHWMMAEKARLFGDITALVGVFRTHSPKEAKAIGRSVEGFNQKVWNAKAIDIVVAGNLAKFTQDQEAREELLSTYPKILVEACPYDRIWGIGLQAASPQIGNLKAWGQNLLGFALTEVRDRIMEGAADA